MKMVVKASYDEDSKFEEIASKQVPDSDGFYTDYTWYENLIPEDYESRYVFVFGDKDRYRPEDENYDFETDDENEAQDWFDSYNGFDDEDDTDIISNEDIDASLFSAFRRFVSWVKKTFKNAQVDTDDESYINIIDDIKSERLAIMRKATAMGIMPDPVQVAPKISYVAGKTEVNASYDMYAQDDEDLFFTRDDLNEFTDELDDRLHEKYGNDCNVSESYIDFNEKHTTRILEIVISDENYEITVKEPIDMRKIRVPRDLNKYIPIVLEEYDAEISQY